jgi:hypothetical protein
MTDENRNPVTTGWIDRLIFREIPDQRIKFRMQTDSSSIISCFSFASLLSFPGLHHGRISQSRKSNFFDCRLFVIH